jgi:elongation factor 1 alpha-like protein
LRDLPRCLVKNSSAIVEIEVDRPVCLELYANFKDLGRFMLRASGTTVAAGLVTEVEFVFIIYVFH